MKRALLFLAVACAALLLAGGRSRPAGQWDHDWLDGGVVYEIFVRSFADSDGDGIGDLPGLIERLDYLNDGDPETDRDLGVRALWLMPVFPSPSYHGYDVTDYEAIEPDYGTLADFERLVEEADRRGIGIVLDLVLNHTSSQHPWFEDAAQSGRFREFYVWSDTNPGWRPPWGGSGRTWHRNRIDRTFYYGVFWRGMPDLNFDSARVRRQAHRLARLWLDRGAAGLRLDAARYLVETGAGPGAQADSPRTHAFWKEFSARIRDRHPRALVVGENWADAATIASYYGSTEEVAGGDELPLNFNFPLADAILDVVRRGRNGALLEALERMGSAYPEGVRDAPFLTNHDQIRVATELGGNPARLRVAASILLTLPGVPFLYYGEEVGLANAPGDRDEAKRTPMPWDDSATVGFTDGDPWYPPAPGSDRANVADQIDRAGSLLDHYRRLIDARGGSAALAAGTLETLASDRSLVVFRRVRGDDRVVVAINLSGGFTVAGPIPEPGRPSEALYRDGAAIPVSGGANNWSIPLPPYGTAIWRFEDE